MERDVNSLEFKKSIHKRMLRFYVLSVLLKKRDFPRFLRDYVFPNINSDRPYPNNIKDWEVDCYIKQHPGKCIVGFVKVYKMLTPTQFIEQVKEAGKEISDIASMAMTSGVFKNPKFGRG